MGFFTAMYVQRNDERIASRSDPLDLAEEYHESQLFSVQRKFWEYMENRWKKTSLNCSASSRRQFQIPVLSTQYSLTYRDSKVQRCAHYRESLRRYQRKSIILFWLLFYKLLIWQKTQKEQKYTKKVILLTMESDRDTQTILYIKEIFWFNVSIGKIRFSVFKRYNWRFPFYL